jgi:hypothetical protein
MGIINTHSCATLLCSGYDHFDVQEAERREHRQISYLDFLSHITRASTKSSGISEIHTISGGWQESKRSAPHKWPRPSQKNLKKCRSGIVLTVFVPRSSSRHSALCR